MSASLVGSEMCIRDRRLPPTPVLRHPGSSGPQAVFRPVKHSGFGESGHLGSVGRFPLPPTSPS
eukprot:8752573-Alexandrium_andersonii.AAC.1